MPSLIDEILISTNFLALEKGNPISWAIRHANVSRVTLPYILPPSFRSDVPVTLSLT
jgi:hypothetical protein